MPNKQATGTVDGIGKQDHSDSAEYWIVGPPGTGKTTTISRQVNLAAREWLLRRAGHQFLASCRRGTRRL
jgi:flagellar biosynthesis GTPase FlhF